MEVIKDFHGRGYTMGEFVQTIRNGKAKKLFSLLDAITVEGKEYEIVSFEDDAVVFMGKELLPERRMFEDYCGIGMDYRDSDLRKWLNDVYFQTLPEVLRDAITPTPLSCTNENKLKKYDEADMLFLPSESEIFGRVFFSSSMDGKPFAALGVAQNRLRFNTKGHEKFYWTRSKTRYNYELFVFVLSDGIVYNCYATNECYVPVCFRIA